jgi:hypothetical protein
MASKIGKTIRLFLDISWSNPCAFPSTLNVEIIVTFVISDISDSTFTSVGIISVKDSGPKMRFLMIPR